MIIDLNQILYKVSQGGLPDRRDLIPFLSHPSRSERCHVNTQLARACKGGPTKQHLEFAKTFIQRAWLLSNYDEDLLPEFIEIHESLKDISPIKEAYKRIGIKAAQNNKISQALKFFNLSMYTSAVYNQNDIYDYDFDVLYNIENLANKYKFPVNRNRNDSKKLKVAYLVFGAYHVGSVIVKILKTLADYHDSNRCDIIFIIPENIPDLELPDHSINLLRQCHWPVIQPTASGKDALLESAATIHNFAPDVLVTSAGLADLSHYFLASLFESLPVVSLLLGPPPQFVAPKFCCAISPTLHPLIESPCDTYNIKIEFELPIRENITPSSRSEYDIPNTAFLLVSGGRSSKFNESDFWKCILSVLQYSENIYFMALGIGTLPESAREALPDNLLRRVRYIGWKNDYLPELSMADVCLDTYPSGGGVFPLEAMALGLPVVGFENNYFQKYNQADWSPLEEIHPIKSFVLKRADWKNLVELIFCLYNDANLRRQAGTICKDFVKANFGNVPRMVSSYENIYELQAKNLD